MTTEVETGTGASVESTGASAPEVAAPSTAAVPEKTPAAFTADPLVPAEPAAAPAFTPNFKFKANQKEMEFDEWLRPAITSEEQEKKIRELYEKAHGLDTVKPERDQLKTEYGTLNQEHQAIQNGLSKLNHFVSKKDYDSFFQALGVPKQDVMQYALLQLKLQEATPEQRAAYEQSRTESQQLYDLQQQNSMLQQQFTQQAAGQRSSELDFAMQKPEVSASMQAFDSRMGRIGAFRDEVIRRGQMYFATTGQDITVDQAVGEVLSLIGQQSAGAPPVVDQSSAGKKPVIPNIQVRGSVSPAKKVINSFEDLKAYAKARIEQNA